MDIDINIEICRIDDAGKWNDYMWIVRDKTGEVAADYTSSKQAALSEVTKFIAEYYA